MPPSLAFSLWFLLLLGLLRFDPTRNAKTSLALWVPVIWLFILGSRLPSQWLGGQMGVVAGALEEGNPLDRSIFSALMLLAIGILASRSFKWADFLARNIVLVAFLAFALLSVIWSDFSLVALKRWFRDLGGYLMVLVVLSDSSPRTAMCVVFRRLCFLLVPLSVVLVKYYPAIGKQYDSWTGVAMYSGVTTSKNMLGVVCLISGLFFFWDTLTNWADRKRRVTKQRISVNLAILVMTLYLLQLSASATSQVCLVLGCLVIITTHSRTFQRHPRVFQAMIPASFLLYLILAFGFGMNGKLAGAVGRDPTLTDRTKIWSLVLSMHTNPLIGTGYESFWLGPRLQKIWQAGLGSLNEAHNGYLQVYLNLGLIGLLLAIGFLFASYRTIWRKLGTSSGLDSLALGVWTVLVFYNMTEAAFGGLLWMLILLGSLRLPERARHRVRSTPEFGFESSMEHLPPVCQSR